MNKDECLLIIKESRLEECPLNLNEERQEEIHQNIIHHNRIILNKKDHQIEDHQIEIHLHNKEKGDLLIKEVDLEEILQVINNNLLLLSNNKPSHKCHKTLNKLKDQKRHQIVKDISLIIKQDKII